MSNAKYKIVSGRKHYLVRNTDKIKTSLLTIEKNGFAVDKALYEVEQLELAIRRYNFRIKKEEEE